LISTEPWIERAIGELQLRDERLRLVITFAAVAGSASLVAFLIGYVAHNDLGLSRIEIRHSAFAAAALVVTLLATGMLGRRGRPK
jgi:hypothetical protein